MQALIIVLSLQRNRNQDTQFRCTSGLTPLTGLCALVAKCRTHQRLCIGNGNCQSLWDSAGSQQAKRDPIIQFHNLWIFGRLCGFRLPVKYIGQFNQLYNVSSMLSFNEERCIHFNTLLHAYFLSGSGLFILCYTPDALFYISIQYNVFVLYI